MDVASLIILCAVIIAAFVLKINSGIIAISVSLVLARIVGISDSSLIKDFFDSKLFINLLGVMLLFGIAQENGTLELLAKKIISLCRGKVKLFPLILFLVAAFIAAIGPGPITVCALIAVIAIALAKETSVPAMHLIPFGALGSFAGGLSAITPTGIVGVSKSEAIGLNDMGLRILLGMAVANFLYAVVLYFFVFRWHRYKAPLGVVATTEISKNEKFNLKQWMTLAGIVVMAVVSVVFNIKIVGLAAFAVSMVLIILKAADEGAVLKKLSWGTLVMITGVGILISLVDKLGGIMLLKELLEKLMTGKTASGIITALAGVMSWVSSASGVVMPTLISPDMIGELATTLNGASASSMIIGVCIGAHAAAISPLSTCGGLMLAAYSSSGITAKERNKAFAQLFIISASGVAFCAVLGLLGLYNIF